jgi:hypothetical protein
MNVDMKQNYRSLIEEILECLMLNTFTLLRKDIIGNSPLLKWLLEQYPPTSQL